MESFQKSISVFKKQLEKGDIQVAYKGILEYVSSLKNHFQKKYPEFQVPSNIYFGYLDMTYFSILTDSLKEKKLKIALVLNYEPFRFEVWLSGVNKKVLSKYWNLIKDKEWGEYRVVKPGPGIDFILEYIIDDNPDFSNLDNLTKKIDRDTLKFINDVEKSLSKH